MTRPARYLKGSHNRLPLIKGKDSPTSFDSLTAGEPFPYKGFTDSTSLKNHAIKHVLQLNPKFYSPLIIQKTKERTKTPSRLEFPEIYHAFLERARQAKAANEPPDRPIDEMTSAYELRARAFMESPKQTILTVTRTYYHIDKNQSVTQTLGYRFDTLTNEFAIFNRDSGVVISYFYIDMKEANGWLKRHQQPLATSPLEFFLTFIEVPQAFHRNSHDGMSSW